MKKILSALMVFIIIFSLSGCSSKPQDEGEPSSQQDTSVQSQSEIVDSQEESTSVGTRPENGTIGPVFDKDVIYDENDIKITVLYLGSSHTGINIYFKIENNSDTAIIIQTRNETVNGEGVGVIGFVMAAPVGARETVIDRAIIFYTDVEEKGIYNFNDIYELEFSFYIFVDEPREVIDESALISLKPIKGSVGVEEGIEAQG